MITVTVEACWSGHHKYWWRLRFKFRGTYHQHGLAHEEGEGWNRRFAGLALDDLVNLYGIPRRQIRFNTGKA